MRFFLYVKLSSDFIYQIYYLNYECKIISESSKIKWAARVALPDLVLPGPLLPEQQLPRVLLPNQGLLLNQLHQFRYLIYILYLDFVWWMHLMLILGLKSVLWGIICIIFVLTNSPYKIWLIFERQKSLNQRLKPVFE